MSSVGDGVHPRWSIKRVVKRLQAGLSLAADQFERPPDADDLARLSRFVVEPASLVPLVYWESMALTEVRLAALAALSGKQAWEPSFERSARSLMASTLARLASELHGEPLRMHFDHTMEPLAMATAAGWLDEVRRALPLVLERIPLGLMFKAHDLDGTAKRPDRQCFPWFTLRLLCDWAALALPARLPHHPFAMPEYDALLTCWRTPDAAALVQPLLDVCDRHTREAIDTGSSDPRKRVDFGEYVLMAWPIEVHMVFRLREDLGLALPTLPGHPLLQTPLALYSPPWPREEDELLRSVLQRARTQLPRLRQLLPEEDTDALPPAEGSKAS